MMPHPTSRSILSLWLALLFPAFLIADDHQNPTTAVQIVDSARGVYDGLFEAAQANAQLSVADIESLNSWSTRIELHELSTIGFWDTVDQFRFVVGVLPPNIQEVGQAMRNAIRDHARRLKQIESMAKRKLEDNTASESTVASARYFHLVADSVVKQMDAIQASVDTIQVPRPSRLVTGKPFVVFVNAKSEIIIDGKRVSTKQLVEIFAKVSDARKDTFVEVKASGDSLHERIVAVMDLASDAGFEVVLSTVE